MNSTLKAILHWGINIILVLAGVGCILLALFGQDGDSADAFTRFMTMFVGIVFLGLGVVFIYITAKKG